MQIVKQNFTFAPVSRVSYHIHRFIDLSVIMYLNLFIIVARIDTVFSR